MTTVDATRPVTGGVDTHLDVNVAAALDAIGGLLGVAEFPTTPTRHRQLTDFLASFGTLTRVGVKGTGSYGACLSRFLRSTGVEVVEVDRPNRQSRRRTGKSDPADAIEAAGAALSGRAQGAAKSRDGNVEAIPAGTRHRPLSRGLGSRRAAHALRSCLTLGIIPSSNSTRAAPSLCPSGIAVNGVLQLPLGTAMRVHSVARVRRSCWPSWEFANHHLTSAPHSARPSGSNNRARTLGAFCRVVLWRDARRVGARPATLDLVRRILNGDLPAVLARAGVGQP